MRPNQSVTLHIACLEAATRSCGRFEGEKSKMTETTTGPIETIDTKGTPSNCAAKRLLPAYDKSALRSSMKPVVSKSKVEVNVMLHAGHFKKLERRDSMTYRFQAFVLLATVAGCGGGNGGTGGSETGSTKAVAFSAVSGTATNGASFSARILEVGASFLVPDDPRQRLYLAGTGTSPVNANMVSILEPSSARIVGQAQTSPGLLRISMSDDGRYLYAGVSGAVERLQLPALTPDISISLGTGISGKPIYAGQIIPMPGHPNTIAVARFDPGLTTGIGVAIFDDAVQRAKTSPAHPVDGAAWSADGQTIYASTGEISSLDLYTYSIGPDGVISFVDLPAAFLAGFADLRLSGGTLIAANGELIDAATQQPAGRYASSGCLMAPPRDADTIIFFLCPLPTDSSTSFDVEIRSFDLDTKTRLGSATIKNLRNGPTGVLESFVRYGATGLAFMSTQNQVVLLDGVFVTSTNRKSLDVPPPTTVVDNGVSSAGKAYRVREMGLSVNAALWDSSRGVFYVSTSGYASITPNRLSVLDPASGALSNATYVGTEPGALALADDGSYLYAGIDGSATLRRISLPALTTTAEYKLGRDFVYGAYYADRIEVAPGAPEIAAVSRRRYHHISPPNDGIAIFDGDGLRPNVGGNLTSDVSQTGNVGYLNGPETDAVAWAGSATELLGVNSYTGGAAFLFYSVDALGLAYRSGISEYLYEASRVVYANGRGYTSAGDVVDIASTSKIGTLPQLIPSPAGHSSIEVDPAIDKAFVVALGGVGSADFDVQIYRLSTLALLDSAHFSYAIGNNIAPGIRRVNRYGSNGLAIVTDDGTLFLLDGNLVQ